MSDIDLDYLRDRLQEADFVPYEWDGEDRNISVFRSKDDLIAWYCQPPGVENQPYRDRGFYARELAMLSRVIQPKVVVELGTSLGIGTCLLRWLNPEARLVTVDVNVETFMPGDRRVPMGHLAKWQGIKCEYVCGNSWDYRCPGVDLCFVDAEHSYEAVLADSKRAWDNLGVFRTAERGYTLCHPWAIVWHDHNDRHPGVVAAVQCFCAMKNVDLQSRSDSDTVWIMGEI